jgi:low affinity Fe/Cu permease
MSNSESFERRGASSVEPAKGLHSEAERHRANGSQPPATSPSRTSALPRSSGPASDRRSHAHDLFRRFSQKTSTAVGSPWAFAVACLAILVWAVSGPLFHFSDTWQLVINTGTTIVTFLMVFLIQNSQNRDNAAIQVKLDEIIRAGEAKNSFVGIEHLTEDEIEDLRTMCEDRAKRADNVVKRIGRKAEEAADAAA